MKLTRGVAITLAIVFFVLMAGCIAVAKGDEGAWSPASRNGHHHRDHDECRKHCQRSGDGDGRKFCFFPCDFVIIVPMPGQSQDQPGPEESATGPRSLVPPNPEKLVGAITGMTKAVGDAAGALAGAIAGGTIGILL